VAVDMHPTANPTVRPNAASAYTYVPPLRSNIPPSSAKHRAMATHSAPHANSPTTLAAPARAASGASNRYTPEPTMPLTPMATQSSSVSRRAGEPSAPATSTPLPAGEVIEVLRDRHLGLEVHVLEPEVVALALDPVADAQ